MILLRLLSLFIQCWSPIHSKTYKLNDELTLGIVQTCFSNHTFRNQQMFVVFVVVSIATSQFCQFCNCFVVCNLCHSIDSDIIRESHSPHLFYSFTHDKCNCHSVLTLLSHCPVFILVVNRNKITHFWIYTNGIFKPTKVQVIWHILAKYICTKVLEITSIDLLIVILSWTNLLYWQTKYWKPKHDWFSIYLWLLRSSEHTACFASTFFYYCFGYCSWLKCI